MATHKVSASCGGEICQFNDCVESATHKVGEEILHDDPFPNRHNLTAYVCCEHFSMILGSVARMGCGLEPRKKVSV